MTNLLKAIKKKVNGVIYTLIGNAIFLLILGILIIWTDYVLRIVVGIMVIVLSYVFFYIAFKVLAVKREISKYIK